MFALTIWSPAHSSILQSPKILKATTIQCRLGEGYVLLSIPVSTSLEKSPQAPQKWFKSESTSATALSPQVDPAPTSPILTICFPSSEISVLDSSMWTPSSTPETPTTSTTTSRIETSWPLITWKEDSPSQEFRISSYKLMKVYFPSPKLIKTEDSQSHSFSKTSELPTLTPVPTTQLSESWSQAPQRPTIVPSTK